MYNGGIEVSKVRKEREFKRNIRNTSVYTHRGDGIGEVREK